MHAQLRAPHSVVALLPTGLHGTPEYAAPEVVIWYWYEIGRQLEEPPPPYGIQADAWALGICLHVMLTGCFPFDVKLAEEDMLRRGR
eukprot:6179606-Pleurochrysis_carterae.AAC.2